MQLGRLWEDGNKGKKPYKRIAVAAGAFAGEDELTSSSLTDSSGARGQRTALNVREAAMTKVKMSGIRVADRAVRAGDLRARLAEREQRQASDHRSEAERWLGDPPLERSALSSYGARPSGRKLGT
jgi:hypothetical protein